MEEEKIIEKSPEEILKETIAKQEENFNKQLEEIKRANQELIEKLSKEKEEAVLASKSEKDKAEYLANQAKLKEEQRIADILKENELLRKEKAEKEEALKAKEELDKLMAIVATKPYLAEKIKTVSTISQYETFIKPFEDDLKLAWEYKQKDGERNANVFKGYKTVSGDKNQDIATRVKEIVANRKK